MKCTSTAFGFWALVVLFFKSAIALPLSENHDLEIHRPRYSTGVENSEYKRTFQNRRVPNRPPLPYKRRYSDYRPLMRDRSYLRDRPLSQVEIDDRKRRESQYLPFATHPGPEYSIYDPENEFPAPQAKIKLSKLHPIGPPKPPRTFAHIPKKEDKEDEDSDEMQPKPIMRTKPNDLRNSNYHPQSFNSHRRRKTPTKFSPVGPMSGEDDWDAWD